MYTLIALCSAVRFVSRYIIFFRSNVNVNDALGDYSLTLVDTLDTLAVSLALI